MIWRKIKEHYAQSHMEIQGPGDAGCLGIKVS